MAKRIVLVLFELVLSAVWAVGSVVSEGQQVAIVVINDAGVPKAELAKAEGLTNKVFSKAGISIAWTIQTARETACAELREQSVCVVVSIISNPATEEGEVLGVASVVPQGMGKFVTVFYNRVRELGSDRLDTSGVLGYVVVHETGHILLGANSHSRLGVMQPRWERSQLRKASMEGLLFTVEQTERMKERIRATIEKKMETAERRKIENSSEDAIRSQ